MKTLKKLGKANLICGIAYIAIAIVLWVLTYTQHTISDSVEGAEAIVLIFTIIFFVIETIIICVGAIYSIAAGIACIKIADGEKNARKLLVTSSVIKIIISIASVIVSFTLCAIFMPIVGAAGFVISAALIVMAVLDIKKSKKEKKNKAE